jgi:DNA end-binding protein Ku
VGDTIVMITLRYPDEIRPTDELKIPDENSKAAQVTPKELQMARALVEGMSERWKPQQYHDTYREDVMAMVKKKIAAKQTKTITMPEPEEADKPAKSNVIDLVSLLQASLGKKPAAAHAGDDDDDDDDPPPRKARKPSKDEDDVDDAPPPRARKTTSSHAPVHARATAAKKPAAKKAVAKAPAKKAVAKSTTATAAKAPARRRKAA